VGEGEAEKGEVPLRPAERGERGEILT
jgi:hypothetical protein